MKDIIIRSRTHANGSIVYEYRFETVGVGGKRKWISKSGFRTKTAAKLEGRKVQADYENRGIITGYTKLSVADYYDYWIEADCMIDLKESTIRGYKKQIKLYIKPALGMYSMVSVTRDMLQRFLLSMYNKGFSTSTMIAIKALITKSFNFAYDNAMIPVNPSVRLKIPRNQAPAIPTRCDPHVYIPRDKLKEIFERFPEGHTSHLPLMIGYKCGLRIGEAFALCWQDIDLENKKISINRQIQWHQNETRSQNDKRKRNGTSDSGGGYWYFAPPKYNSYRVIDIDDELCELLKRTRKTQQKNENEYAEYYINYFSEFPLLHTGEKPLVDSYSNRITEGRGKNKIELICRRESGQYITPRTLQHTSYIIHHKLNFPEFDYHSLRHTHATMLTEAGAPPKYIQKRLGHSRVDMTMNVYQHLTESITAEGNDVLNKLYK